MRCGRVKFRETGPRRSLASRSVQRAAPGHKPCLSHQVMRYAPPSPLPEVTTRQRISAPSTLRRAPLPSPMLGRRYTFSLTG
jgi:hypothetical protein